MRRLLGLVAVVTLAVSAWSVASPAPVAAIHSWGNYHWARTTNPFTLKLGDDVSSTWDPYRVAASSDWSVSTVLDTANVAGNTNGRLCRASSGTVQVCDAAYGFNGWLGLASIWASGDHITQGTVKLNDSYFNTSTYNTPAWRQMVTCQEIGHTFGLDHQDTNFDNPNLGTCMDYTRDPSTNQQPNQHDYDQLGTIYAHLDSTTTVGANAPSGPGRGQGIPDAVGDTPADWGVAVRNRADGRPILYRRDLGAGQAVFTWVTWADHLSAARPR